jgi:hypothetical protein
MLKPFRLAICLLVATALGASGCGSSSKAGTTTTTTPQATTTAPSNQTAQTGGQSTKGAASAGHNTGGVQAGTSSTSAQPTTTSAQQLAKPPAPQVKPKPAESVLTKTLTKSQKKKAEEIVARANQRTPGFLSEVPPARRYEPQVYLPFLARCKAGKGSTPSCECIVVKQELLSNIEKGRAIAELLTIQLALEQGSSLAKIAHHGVLLPPNIQRAAVECIKF